MNENQNRNDNPRNTTLPQPAPMVSRSQLKLNLAYLLEKSQERSVPVFIQNRKTLQHVLIPWDILPESLASWLKERFDQVMCQSRLESGL